MKKGKDFITLNYYITIPTNFLFGYLKGIIQLNLREMFQSPPSMDFPNVVLKTTVCDMKSLEG